jgi:single stranded DNA-binding protein
MFSTLSCFNSQLMRAAAPKGVTTTFSAQISSRAYSYATGGSINYRRSVALRRFTATQAAYQEAPPQSEIIGEAEWNKDLVNCVSLIGNLAGPLEIKSTPNSQVATGQLAVNDGKDRNGTPKPPVWINIETWGELAQCAATELKKGQKIQVLGRMKRNEYTGKDGVPKVEMKVKANQINRIVDYISPAYNNDAPTPTWDQPPSQEQTAQYAAYGEDQTVDAPWGADATPAPIPQNPGEDKWVHLMQNLDQYYDNRLSKKSPKGPDFKGKSKDKDVALWLDGAPQWVHDKLKDIPAPPPYVPSGVYKN